MTQSPSNGKKASVIIPVYNESERLTKTWAELLESLSNQWRHDSALQDLVSIDIIVVDDGSAPAISRSAFIRKNPAESSLRIQTHLLRHPINLGQGAALQTGIEYARDNLNSDLFVTMDADGQHCPEDLPVLLDELRKGASIVFGNRWKNSQNSGIPIGRKWILKTAIAFERLMTGVQVGDAHNGFRVFDRNCAQCIHLRQNRMAHATEFKKIIGMNKISYAEAPVKVRYTSESLSKGQKNIGSLHILRDLLKGYLFNG